MTGVEVTVRAWSWRYASRSETRPRDVSFDVKAGERVLLSGPSGSGKSTILSALAGVLGDDQGVADGEMLVAGAPPTPRRGLVGLVLQDPEFQTIRESVGDDVAFGCENHAIARDEIWRRVDEALRVVGLDVGRDHPTRALSGGQKQRLALAGVLAMNAALVLLDEPTANLDPEGAQLVVEAVAAMASRTGCTVIVVDHQPHLWTDVVTRVISVDADPVTAASERKGSGHVARGLSPLSGGTDSSARRSGSGRGTAQVALASAGLVVARRQGRHVSVPDLRIEEGSWVALIGPNGSGKTTLALTLGGLLAPVSGQLVVGPRVSAGAPRRRANEPWRWSAKRLAGSIGNVFQSPEYQFVSHTVTGELALALSLRGGRQSKSPATRNNDLRVALERLHLDHLAHVHPFTLSGGEQRRLSLAAVLLAEPDLIVADEPTFGQDDDTWIEVVAMLQEARTRGATIISATHDSRLWDRADDILRLPGRTERQGGEV